MQDIFSNKKIRNILTFIAVYALSYYIIIYIFKDSSEYYKRMLSNIFTIVGEISAIAILFTQIKQMSGRRKKLWGFFFVGLIFNFMGDFLWSYYEIVKNTEVPDVSFCDLFYSLASASYLIAVIRYVYDNKVSDMIKTGFDISITMVVSSTLIIKYVMLPIWVDTSVSLFEKMVYLSYPIFDLGYIGGLISLIILSEKSRKLAKQNIFIGISFCFWFVADIIFTVLSDSTYVSGGYTDPLWPIGCLFISLASAYTFTQQNEEYKGSYKIKNPMEILKIIFPYIFVSIILIITAYNYMLKDVLIAGTIITIILVVGRQIFSMNENRRLINLVQNSNNLLEESNKKLLELSSQKEIEANTDFLTGLYNRRYINHISEELKLEQDKKESFEISLILIDVDHFKRINDQNGHKTGDRVLKTIADIIKMNTDSMDIAGRFGGDEFIIILPHKNLKYAKKLLEKIMSDIEAKNYMFIEANLRITLSMGCIHWSGSYKNHNMEKLIIEADKALYKAKEEGRNRFITREMDGK